MIERLTALTLLSTLAACTAPPRDVAGEQANAADTATTSEGGTPETSAGWCCGCDVYIGDALACTPARESACMGEGLAWCLLDAEGNPSDCEATCDAARADGWCCDCDAPIPEYPRYECWPTDKHACSYEWCERGKGPEVPAACTVPCKKPTVCCSCLTKTCWGSDGSDCTDSGEYWCHLDAKNYPTKCFDACK